MRDIMRMVERLERPREGPPVPDTLYFGTCQRVWDAMEKNTLNGPEGSITFTTDWHRACKIAARSATKHEDSKPIVLVINGDDLARKFNITTANETDAVHGESEWKIEPESIDQVDRYITAIEPAYSA